MFLKSIGSNDPRFKSLEFHEGMNLVLAEKANDSDQTNSRNGAGKTSIIRILRFLLGGRRTDWIKSLASYMDQSLWADFERGEETLHIERNPGKSDVQIGQRCMGSKEWERTVGRMLLGFDVGHDKPTGCQVFAHLVRTEFHSPVKTDAHESDQSSGARIGFYFGMSSEVLAKAEKASAFEANKKALTKAVKEGAIGGLGPGKAECEADLVKLEMARSDLASRLSSFRVDESYAVHQAKANALSKRIARLNDSVLSMNRRRRELEEAIRIESEQSQRYEAVDRINRLYKEAGVLLPDSTLKSFEDVVVFHESVSRNRHLFLEDELQSVSDVLAQHEQQIKELDKERSLLLVLLKKTMALDSFLSAQQDLSDLDSKIAKLKSRLEDFEKLDDMKSSIRTMRVDASNSMRLELKENEFAVKMAVRLFVSLCEEIYSDRKATLDFSVSDKGELKVIPKIEGDASKGINEVSIFLFDIACVITGMQTGVLPGFLVHDSQLFDAMDDRQLASCLNIGARLSKEYGFQYIVTLNTDRLAAAEGEGFDRSDYALPIILTDEGEGGGLFGFRFD